MPLVGKYIDLAHVEPLHLKKNRSAMRTWVLCFMLVCSYSFRLEFCFQMSVSGSLTAASEKVDK